MGDPYRNEGDASITIDWVPEEVDDGLEELFAFLERHGVELSDLERRRLRPYATAFGDTAQEPGAQKHAGWFLVDQLNRMLREHGADARFWRTSEASDEWLLLTPQHARELRSVGRQILSEAPDPAQGMLGPALASLGAGLLAVGTMTTALILAKQYLALGVCACLLVVYLVASRRASEDKPAMKTGLSFAPWLVAIAVLLWIARYQLAGLVLCTMLISAAALQWVRKAGRAASETTAS